MHKKRTELRDDEDGYITIDGRSWEDWTVAQLLDLTDELAVVRCGSWQLVQLATDTITRREAQAAYSADLQREIAAYRAIGHLRMMLDPGRLRTTARVGADRSRAVEDEETAASVERLEYVLGCELAGICPDGSDFPGPDSVMPRDRR